MLFRDGRLLALSSDLDLTDFNEMIGGKPVNYIGGRHSIFKR
jgi:hypothetical protein